MFELVSQYVIYACCHSENGRMGYKYIYIYSTDVMHVFSDIFYHMVVIVITSIYMALIMYPCARVCHVVMSIMT